MTSNFFQNNQQALQSGASEKRSKISRSPGVEGGLESEVRFFDDLQKENLVSEFKEGQLRVWHFPQNPGAPFHVGVDTPQEAQQVLQLLANYDIFQFENNIKSDYCSAQGLEVFESGEWCEWIDPIHGDEIDEWVGE